MPIKTIWTERDAATNNDYEGIVFGNGIFVAVADNDVDGGQIMTSPDGVTWTARAASEVKTWTAIAWNGSVFCVCGVFSTDIMTSSDGITWTTQSGVTQGADWLSICVGSAGRFIMVAGLDFGDGVVLYSDDNGVTWNQGSGISGPSWKFIDANGSKVVAVADNGAVMYSANNGITWTSGTPASSSAWRGIVYALGLFVVVASDGHIMTSPDGITWTSRIAAATSAWVAIAFGNGLFVAVAGNGDYRVMISEDGINWAIQICPEFDWTAIAYGSGLFVAVSESGSGKLMTSPGLEFIGVDEWQLFSFEDVENQFRASVLAAVNSPATPVQVLKTHEQPTTTTTRVQLTLTTQQNQGQRYLLNPTYPDMRMQPFNVWFFQLSAEVFTNRGENNSLHWPLVGKTRLALSWRKLVPFFSIELCPLHSVVDIQETPEQLAINQDGNLDQTKMNFAGMIAIRDSAWSLV